MKHYRFLFKVIVIPLLFLIPQHSLATCFFDQASISVFNDQCEVSGGKASSTYFPPSQIILGCIFEPPGSPYFTQISASNCDDIETPSPQSPGNPPGGPNNCQQGSIIMVEKKSVGETVNVIGTPYSLNYMSHKANRIMDRTATLSFIQGADFYNTRLNIRVGNSRTFTYNYSKGQITNGFKQPFTWDGLDENGNVVVGSTIVSAQTVYTPEGGNTGPLSTFQLFYLRPLDFKKIGLGGWTLNVHHFYDSNERVIYYGDGTDAFAPGIFDTTADTNRVFSKDNSEVYEFSATTKRHLRTLFGTKGTTKYTFNYNANGSLISVVDYNGLQTTIQRDSVTDAPISITGPYGHVTTLQTNANGNLSRIQFGSFENHLMTYQNDLLKTYRNPRGVVNTFTYDSIGRLINDQSAAGSSVDLSFLNLDNGTSTTTTSAMGLARNYTTSIISDTDRSILSTKKTIPTMQPTEMSANILLGNYVLSSSTDDVGGANLSNYSADPRTQNPFITESSYRFEQLISGSTEYRIVQMNPTDNLFDIASYTRGFINKTHINGQQTSTLVYDGALSSYTYTSPLSRQTKVTVDNVERPTQYQFAADHPMALSYDSQGRLSQVSQSNRTILYRYSSLGNIANIRNSLGQITRFTHDRSGKMTSQTLPDGRQTLFTYDKNSNLTSVTPPGKPAQALTYNNFDLLSGYLTTNPTTWNYDNDRKISSMVRPDGATAQYNYDTATARLTSIATPQGSYLMNNNPDWNLLDSARSPDNVQETFTYTAGLLTSIQMQAPTTMQWSRTLNNNFETETSSVQNGTSINYIYDNDSDLIQVGDLNITRNATNGRITRTQLNRIFENKSYSAFGEMTVLRNRYQNSRIYQDYKFTRDRLGRISQKLETLEGTPQSTFNYIYDTSGRLTSVQKNGTSVLSQVFDSNSNRTQVTENGSTINATYDSNDQILTWGTLQFTHNLNSYNSIH
jgi:YD repeat-containing protein